MGTIIQTYGPIYGENVNGTVQGRPNGSVYVPISNRIELTGSEYIRNRTLGDNKAVQFCDSLGDPFFYTIVAESQDLASNIRIILAEDSALTTIVGFQSFTAGRFNLKDVTNILNNFELTEATYYVAAVLINNSSPVATSSVLEVTVVS